MGGYHGGKTLKERFDEKWHLAENGCWNWRFPKPNKGGDRANTFNFNGTTMNAVKASWLMHRGNITPGHIICHRCDNGLCVNPDHLWVGTHAQNTADMFAKGRAAKLRGADHASAKLTEADVLCIREVMTDAPRGTLARLTRQYGVNHSTLQDILHGRTWAHLITSGKT